MLAAIRICASAIGTHHVMQTKTTVEQRTDALDAEAFSDMVRSHAFALLRDRIQRALSIVSNDCEREDDHLKMRRAQGQVAALRMVLGLPDQMLAEMKQGLKGD